MRHRHVPRHVATAALVIAVVAAGCSSTSDEAATSPTTAAEVTTDSSTGSTAASGPEITLTIGTDDSPGVPSADQIQHFADEVARLSDGRVAIDPQWHAAGDRPDWDQAVARLVQRGDLDLAVGPTWAWDMLEVTSLQPLQTPFLVDSDALAARIVTDPDLTEQLFSGLPAAGVQGISMWPEGLRHPFGFHGALDSLDAYRGVVIRSPSSATSTDILEALGASTSAEEPDAATMAGSHAEYALSPNGIGVANLTFFPKINLLYANADTFDALDGPTRDLLAEAAANTQGFAIGQADDVAAGKQFCDDGGSIVVAPDAAVSAIHDATNTLTAEITTAHEDVVQAITAIKETLPAPTAAAACGDAGTTTDGTSSAAASELNGTYRFNVSVQELLDGGSSPNHAANNAGVQTYILQDGVLQYHLDPSERAEEPGDSADGTYDVDGNTITLRIPAFDNETDELTFVRSPNGDLTMTLVSSNQQPDIVVSLTAHTWEKID